MTIHTTKQFSLQTSSSIEEEPWTNQEFTEIMHTKHPWKGIVGMLDQSALFPTHIDNGTEFLFRLSTIICSTKN